MLICNLVAVNPEHVCYVAAIDEPTAGRTERRKQIVAVTVDKTAHVMMVGVAPGDATKKVQELCALLNDSRHRDIVI
jgi:hypothetical protein